MTSIGIGIGGTGPVFTQYRIDTKMCSIAHPYCAICPIAYISIIICEDNV